MISYLQNRLFISSILDYRSSFKDPSREQKAKVHIDFKIDDQEKDQIDENIFDSSSLFPKEQPYSTSTVPYSPHY